MEKLANMGEFSFVALNNKNEVLSEITVALGTCDEARVRPAELFRELMAAQAVRTIVVHNHPSGDPLPSPEDLALTSRLEALGLQLGIPVLDSIVVATDGYYSARDAGVMGGK